MKLIDYYSSGMQMGDLLISNGVSPRSDFSRRKLRKLARQLEDYMSSNYSGTRFLILDMKKFLLLIKGADEASYLYQYL